MAANRKAALRPPRARSRCHCRSRSRSQDRMEGAIGPIGEIAAAGEIPRVVQATSTVEPAPALEPKPLRPLGAAVRGARAPAKCPPPRICAAAGVGKSIAGKTARIKAAVRRQFISRFREGDSRLRTELKIALRWSLEQVFFAGVVTPFPVARAFFAALGQALSLHGHGRVAVPHPSESELAPGPGRGAEGPRPSFRSPVPRLSLPRFALDTPGRSMVAYHGCR